MKSDDIDKFIHKYNSEYDMYREWGEYVKKYIFDNIDLSKQELAKMIKIPVEPRVKDVDSIIGKAFYRVGKSYKDPYNDITDKVGVRFVLMVEPQIKKIVDIIEAATIWVFSKDMDYEKAKEDKPEIFVYQSVHFIVRNIKEIISNGIKILAGTPCEIQIRTLEQHSYAELSHDYVYKSNDLVDFKIKRNLAKSMALNETADELFSRVYEMMEKEKEKYYEMTKCFMSLFNFYDYNEKINKDIYDSLKHFIDKYDITNDQLCQFTKQYMLDKISKRQDVIIFKQPMIILLYYLAKEHGAELEGSWEFTQDTLTPIYSDMGISFEGFS